MIEVVVPSDLDRLGALLPEMSNSKQRATGILMEIAGRLARPRAYISEPTHVPDEGRMGLWHLAYDILSVDLRDMGMSIIEGDTISDLSLFCPVLSRLSDISDPLWQSLASCKYIDALYLPADGERHKRHEAMRRHAKALGIKVSSYRPQLVHESKSRTPRP